MKWIAGALLIGAERARPAIPTCLGLPMLAGCAPQPGGAAPTTPIAVLEPGMARIWVLRQPSSPDGNIAASEPVVYAKGAPLAPSTQGTAFYHDFEPGTYRRTVQPCGTATNHVDTVQLPPGMEACVQVEPVPNWEIGSTSGGGSFIVATMSPQEAQQFLPVMKSLGQR